MGRKSRAFRDRTRRLSDSELLQLFDQGLTTLQHLASTYDAGYAPIAFPMALEVQRILTENTAAQRLRAARLFPTPTDNHGPHVLTPLQKLVAAKIGDNPPAATFVPRFYVTDPIEPVLLAFREWWNSDAIFRASAALPGSPPGMIPVNDTPAVPFEKRETINRRQLVQLLRDTVAAHQAPDMPLLLDELQSSHSFGAEMAVQMPDGTQLSTMDGTLPIIVGPLPAMMRQIVHELLVAYGRDDPSPAAA